MRAKFCVQAPPALFVLAVFFALFFFLGRKSSNVEDFPAFLSLPDNYISVELAGEVDSPGVYQINDDLSFASVISLTGLAVEDDSLNHFLLSEPLRNGESIKFIKKGLKISSFRRSWMPASHRVSMGIPLHPDRMSADDWQFLPGVGKTLANRLELDRQKNGDFLTLDGLLRVKGVGLKSIERWRLFFL